MMKMAISQKLRDEESELNKQKNLKKKKKKKIRIKDSDVIHALIRKHLKDLSANDVLEYRKIYLGKDD